MWDVVHHFVDVIVCTAWQFFAEFQVKAFYVNSCDMLRAVTMIFRSYCVEKVKSLMSNLLPEEMVSVVRTIATEKCVGRSISKVSAWLRENVTIGKKKLSSFPGWLKSFENLNCYFVCYPGPEIIFKFRRWTKKLSMTASMLHHSRTCRLD